MREIPRYKVALVNAAVLFWRETAGKSTGIEIIHVLMNGDIRGDKCIEQQKVQISKKIEAFLRDISVCV